jgi:hypothetical protein
VSFSEIANTVLSFSKDNPIIAVIVGLILLFLLFRKPKLFFGLFFLAAILALIFYFIEDVSSKGKSGKEEMIEKGIGPNTDNIR